VKAVGLAPASGFETGGDYAVAPFLQGDNAHCSHQPTVAHLRGGGDSFPLAAEEAEQVDDVDRVVDVVAEQVGMGRARPVLLQEREPHGASGPQLTGALVERCEAAIEPDHEHPAARLGQLGQRLGLLALECGRLLHEDVNAHIEELLRNGKVRG
jgi:hypothetical protein